MALLVSALGMVAIAAPSALALAQGTSQLKIAPALIEETVNPGDTFTSSVTVTNPDSVAKTLTLSVEDITGINDAGEPEFSSTTASAFGVSSWVTIPQSTVTIPANGSKVVSFTVNVPKDAAPGGHYGAFFVSFGPQRPSVTGAGVGYEVGTLIELRLAGQANEEAQITEFSTDKGLYQGADVTFTATLENTGNVIVRPRGPIDVVNMFGQKVATVIMNDGNEAIFPSSSRSFTATWTGSGFMIGRYDAVMSLSYGDQVHKTVTATASFWIVPIVPIVAVLGSIVFFIVLFIWSIRAYVRRRVNEMNARNGGGGKVTLSDEERFLYQSRLPFSRFAFIVIATIVFAIIFLFVLFLLFG